ncbi:16S rRNA (guanine(527)-N(7))-methyltransferase RsmG [Enorma phocaeensis]|uniref:16S rRNA (guanine(527)-N(7))-methyltransferase RsmG n=1 Tax=Enorma phocaeensis TaxID=1871019 RepID=UPI000C861B73|nr:16S rRNA (guanine(527)-N(7))-methyltransferase RsmG [Enorma phocaeensis]
MNTDLLLLENPNEYVDKLSAYLDDYSIELNDGKILQCLQHLKLVLEANRKMNLTRILNIDDALVLHILDSLLLHLPLAASPEGSFIDIGTGAGYPGIPLAISSGRPAVLLDSVGKKVYAVNSFISDLHLDNVSAVHDRVEHYALLKPEQFTSVVARALAPIPVLLEYASPLVLLGGFLIITKGRPSHDEVDSGNTASRICGFDLIDRMSFDLPKALGHREIFVYEKIGPSSIKLPRSIGTAKSNPLA